MVKFGKDMGEKDKANLKTKIDEIYTQIKSWRKI
jgi:hypothetical protein